MAKDMYKEMDIKDIIAYCQEQGPEAVAWLKETADIMVPYKVYPRMKVQKEVDGEIKTVSVADKSQEPKIEMRPISFVQIKTAFLEHFNLKPAAEKKPNMYDVIKGL